MSSRGVRACPDTTLSQTVTPKSGRRVRPSGAAVLLVLALAVLSMVAACGGGGDGEENAAEDSATDSEAEANEEADEADDTGSEDDEADDDDSEAGDSDVETSGDDDGDDEDVVEVVRAPLTGLEWDETVDRSRTALLVKIDNIEGLARPQVGLDAADVVIEEKIEGASTRFAAVFHSQSSPFGPIRSGRSTDVAVIHALNRPGLIMSGANRIMLGQLLGSPVRNFTYDGLPNNYDKRDDRRAPDHFFSETDRFWEEPIEDSKAPPQWFRFRRDDLAEGERAPCSETAEPASGVSMNWGTGAGSGPVDYEWNDATDSWDRTQADEPHVLENGNLISPANVLVQFVDYRSTGLVDPAGSPIPEAALVGEGEMWAFVDGEVMVGTWKRPELSKLTRWLDRNGRDITISPGQTYIELVSPGDAEIIG